MLTVARAVTSYEVAGEFMSHGEQGSERAALQQSGSGASGGGADVSYGLSHPYPT